MASSDSKFGPSGSMSPQYVGDAQDDMHRSGSDEVDPALGPLERIQRKWGIGDRKTRDGAPAKRRGPKPDSKPAMTRRQELNRQAQRTHRERKENYMRELEITVSDLRKLYQESQDENKKLKGLLAAHGIQYDVSSPTTQSYTTASSVVGAPSGGSMSGYTSQSTGYASPPNQAVSTMSMGQVPSPSFQQQSSPSSSLAAPRSNMHPLDYEEVGLDFVGTLEQNCNSHSQYMVNRSLSDEDWFSGHALMATAVPREHCEQHGLDVPYPHKLPDLPKPDLAKMLKLSSRLPGLEGELTPVMAFAFILQHPAAPQLAKEDFDRVTEDLKPKVTCYGFGAVLERFEVEDAIMKVVTAKATSPPHPSTDMGWELVSKAAQS